MGKTRDLFKKSRDTKVTFPVLKRKLQHFGHLMQSVYSFEKTLMLGRTRDLFKKIRDTKRTSHAKMGSIKDRNGMDVTEPKILRRGGKNTQKTYKKIFFLTQITTMVSSLA